jgi:DNA-binding transcriptional ArsR family regulator
VFEEELDLIRATPPRRIRRDLEIRFRRGPVPPVLREFETSPRRAVGKLADQLESYWRVALEPHWPRVRALLEADIAHRARALTEGGPAALFADLHPAVAWQGPILDVEQAFRGHVVLGGRGLLMMPSAFAWDTPVTITEPPWQPTLIYPARGVATLWESGGERTPEALAAAIGRTRAALLAELDAPRSTTDVARLLGITPGGASQHIGVLRDAGLVVGRREGRSVLYVRTPVADALVAGEPEPR